MGPRENGALGPGRGHTGPARGFYTSLQIRKGRLPEKPFPHSGQPEGSP